MSDDEEDDKEEKKDDDDDNDDNDDKPKVEEIGKLCLTNNTHDTTHVLFISCR